MRSVAAMSDEEVALFFYVAREKFDSVSDLIGHSWSDTGAKTPTVIWRQTDILSINPMRTPCDMLCWFIMHDYAYAWGGDWHPSEVESAVKLDIGRKPRVYA